MAVVASETVFKQLVDLAKEISRGDYGRAQEVFDLTLDSQRNPDIEELAEALGMMLVQVEAREFRLSQLIVDLERANEQLETTLRKVRLLENIKSHLDKFVPESVKTLIADNPDAPDLEKKDRDVSILFLDVAGYTKLSEKTDREEMNYLIERYFSAFLDDIHQNDGDINETAGDGLMIIYQNQDGLVHAANAIKTARAIQAKVDQINLEDAARHEPIAVNVGINSGLCSVGSTRFEGVSGTRWTFTASGSATNMAARIGGLATNGQVLMGEETYTRVAGNFEIDDFGFHQLKNVAKAAHIFELKINRG